MKIVKRCCYCTPKHLINSSGNPIPGRVDDPSVLYSDGICRAADKIENEKLDRIIEAQKVVDKGF